MTEKQVLRLLELAGAVSGPDGWNLPAKTTITFAIAQGASAVSVTEIDHVATLPEDLVSARSTDGSNYLIPLASVIFGSFEGKSSGARKTGFGA